MSEDAFDRFERTVRHFAGLEGLGMHVVAVGDPFDGLEIYGPFKTGEDAHRWGEHYYDCENWREVPLKAARPIEDQNETRT